MPNQDIPDDVYFWIDNGKVVEHIWVRVNGEEAFLGITAFGIEEMGDLMSLAPTAVGRSVEPGDAFATVESSKWVGPVATPIQGRIAEVNESLVKNPSLISDDPYHHWIVKIAMAGNALPPSLVSGPAGKNLYLQTTRD